MEIMQLKRTARLRCSKVQHETTRKKLRCNTVHHKKRSNSEDCNTKKVQLEKRYNMKRVQHVKTATRKKSNTK